MIVLLDPLATSLAVHNRSPSILVASITHEGRIALSVEICTNFSTLFLKLASMMFSRPLMLTFTASIGLYSLNGKCLIAAALKI